MNVPRKRPLDVRIEETSRKMDDLELEKRIAELRAKRQARRNGGRRRRRNS